MVVRVYNEADIAGRLVAVRKSKGLTQGSFAKSIGISSRALTNYELSLRTIPLGVIAEVSQVFSISVNWLIFGEGDPSGLAVSVPDINARIIHCVRKFEDDRGFRFAVEKESMIFNFLFAQIAQGHFSSDAEIEDYLKTTV